MLVNVEIARETRKLSASRFRVSVADFFSRTCQQILRSKRTFSIFLLLVFSFRSIAQTDSCTMQISLLTCSPGRELYSTFGHSALRAVDSSKGFDLIYNYGTFDFNDPDFYTKFTRGKLLYFVSIQKFEDFKNDYVAEGRGITEQVLHVNCEQKQKILAFLEENAKDENKYYKY